MSHRFASSSPSKPPDSAPEVRGSVSDLALALDRQAKALALGEQASEARRALFQWILNKPSIKPIRRKPKKSKAASASTPQVESSESSRSREDISIERSLKQERDNRLAATAHLRGPRGRPDPRIASGKIDSDAGEEDHEFKGPKWRFLVAFSVIRREWARRRAQSPLPPSDESTKDPPSSDGRAKKITHFDRSNYPMVWELQRNTENQPSTSSASPPQASERPPFMPLDESESPELESQLSSSSTVPPQSLVEGQRSPSLSDWTLASTPPPSAVLALNHPLAPSVMASNCASSDSVAREGDVEKRTTSESSAELRNQMHPPSFTLWSSEENSQRSENSSDENSQRSENSSNENSQSSEDSSDENSQPVENPSDEDLQSENPTDRPHEEPQDEPQDEPQVEPHDKPQDELQEEAAPIVVLNPRVSKRVAVSPIQSGYDASLSDDAMTPPSPKRQRHSEDSS